MLLTVSLPPQIFLATSGLFDPRLTSPTFNKSITPPAVCSSTTPFTGPPCIFPLPPGLPSKSVLLFPGDPTHPAMNFLTFSKRKWSTSSKRNFGLSSRTRQLPSCPICALPHLESSLNTTDAPASSATSAFTTKTPTLSPWLHLTQCNSVAPWRDSYVSCCWPTHDGGPSTCSKLICPTDSTEWASHLVTPPNSP